MLACLPFLIKNPPRRTQVTQRRKNASINTHIFKTRMAKYYPDIAKGAKGTRSFKPVLFYYFVPCFALFSVQTKARSLVLLRRGSPRRGVSPFFLSSFSSKKQIYSPALCPTKTNSPWTRNQSPAGYVFSPLSLVFIRSRERLAAFFAFESSSDERSKHRKIFAPVPLGRKSPDEEKRTKRTFSHARTLSLSFNL